MNGLVGAERNSTKEPCPVSPFGAGVADGTQCDSYVTGAGSDFVTTFWLTSKDAVPVKEYQVLSGKEGFSITTWFSDWQVGEPSSALFDVPKGCPSAPPSPIPPAPPAPSPTPTPTPIPPAPPA